MKYGILIRHTVVLLALLAGCKPEAVICIDSTCSNLAQADAKAEVQSDASPDGATAEVDASTDVQADETGDDGAVADGPGGDTKNHCPEGCDDGNPCTDDACDNGCKHTNSAKACDDGDACTTGDACAGGKCVGTSVTKCDDGNACTGDSCDKAKGCQHVNNTAACDDKNACTLSDKCQTGKCSGQAVDCNDGNACTTDSCEGGACKKVPNKNPCNDLNPCTKSDQCDGGGNCTGSNLDTCDDGNSCTADNCDAKVGCTHQAKSSPPGWTVSCDDGDKCTGPDVCQSGKCMPGAAVSCDDKNACTDDSCDKVAGCKHVNNTAPCNDGIVWTSNDKCDGAGKCGNSCPEAWNLVIQASDLGLPVGAKIAEPANGIAALFSGEVAKDEFAVVIRASDKNTAKETNVIVRVNKCGSLGATKFQLPAGRIVRGIRSMTKPVAGFFVWGEVADTQPKAWFQRFDNAFQELPSEKVGWVSQIDGTAFNAAEQAPDGGTLLVGVKDLIGVPSDSAPYLAWLPAAGSGKIIEKVLDHKGALTGLAVLPDKKSAAVVGENFDSTKWTLAYWDLASASAFALKFPGSGLPCPKSGDGAVGTEFQTVNGCDQIHYRGPMPVATGSASNPLRVIGQRVCSPPGLNDELKDYDGYVADVDAAGKVAEKLFGAKADLGGADVATNWVGDANTSTVVGYTATEVWLTQVNSSGQVTAKSVKSRSEEDKGSGIAPVSGGGFLAAARSQTPNGDKVVWIMRTKADLTSPPLSKTSNGCTTDGNAAGCGLCACESAVCSKDAYCCLVAWDATCVKACKDSGKQSCP